MSRIEQMRTRLASLEPRTLDIVDDSAKHAGHTGANGGGHYRVHIVSPHFLASRIADRHRMVYSALGDMMLREIHALSITARTPEES